MKQKIAAERRGDPFLRQMIFCLTFLLKYGIIYLLYEKLAQLAEHLPFKERVEGSSPSFLTHEYFVNTLFSCIGRTAYFLLDTV